MNYRNILWLHVAALGESIIFKILIHYRLVVCIMEELNSIYSIIAMVTVKNMLIIGGYQMYFWPQKNHDVQKKKYLTPTAFDKYIPAIPEVFWIYSPLYYVFFSLAILCLRNLNSSAMHAWIMLLHSSFWFVCFPTAIQKEFRTQIRSVKTDRVTRFIMNLVHNFDSEDNACPSMHCAFAVFLAFITYPYYPFLSIVFPFLVSVSCLLTKQHILIDIIPGLVLGALHGCINVMMM